MEKENYILIFLASALLIGYAYGLDLPQALQYPLREEPFNYTNLQFNLLYFFTFVPVILFQIPIGVLIDKYPIRKTMYFMVILSFLSQLTAGLAFEFMIPGYKWVVIVTRSTFGVCGQALFTIQAIFLTFFARQNFQITMGICLSLPFIFDSLNSVITTHVYDGTHYMALTWYIAAFICFLSLVAGFILDRRYITRIQDMQKMDLQILNQALIESQNTFQTQEQKQQTKDNQEFNFKSLKKLNSQFWVVTAAIFFFQACLGPFFDNLNDLLVKRFNISYTDSGKMLLIPFSLLVVFAYILAKIGSIAPHWRRKILLIVASTYFVSISILYILPNTDNPTSIYYICICFFLLMMSMMFACEYCVLITSISYFSDKQVLGTAYSVAATSLGACQCLLPLVNSAILDQYKNYGDSYSELSLFGAGIAMFPIIFSLWLNRKQFNALDYNLKDDFDIVKKRKNSHR